MSPQSWLLNTAYPEPRFCLSFSPTSSNFSSHLWWFSGKLKRPTSTQTYPLQTYIATILISFTIWKIYSSKIATSKLPLYLEILPRILFYLSHEFQPFSNQFNTSKHFMHNLKTYQNSWMQRFGKDFT